MYLIKTSEMPAAKKIVQHVTPTKVKDTKAAAQKSKEKLINYTDKSKDQPHLLPLFQEIKKLMKPYLKGTMVEVGNGGMYNLISKKEIEVDGRLRSEVYFASTMVQKGFVGFYFMPVYMNGDADKIVKPKLMKCLKGKACFHIKKNEPVLLEQIQEALEKGYEAYKMRGWV